MESAAGNCFVLGALLGQVCEPEFPWFKHLSCWSYNSHTAVVTRATPQGLRSLPFLAGLQNGHRASSLHREEQTSNCSWWWHWSSDPSQQPGVPGAGRGVPYQPWEIPKEGWAVTKEQDRYQGGSPGHHPTPVPFLLPCCGQEQSRSFINKLQYHGTTKLRQLWQV